GVAGFAVPGMRVDVLVAGVPPGSPAAEGPAVKTILQNVEVLSAGQNYQKDAEGKPVVVPVVNLLVTPEQAEILSLAGNETRLQLVLRNPLDTEPSKPPGTSLTALFDHPRPVAPRPRPVPVAPPAKPAITAPEPYQIEIFNGAKRSEASFARLMEEPE
ncbi:MAG TPA: Flp pilus assembly protein CpaB, partial [Bryobacteraceae bacterium]|nr:Flp pilus assembly protein CpaB [Bryobacteraceae bacterium]